MGKGIELSYLDPKIDPAEDFYLFVNGGWLRKTEIPEDRSSWGSFHELAKTTDQKVLSILDGELAVAGASDNIAARLFESGMDLSQIEASKIEAIQMFIDQINQVTEPEQWTDIIGRLQQHDLGGLIQLSVHPDLGNSKIYSLYLEPGGLGLPEKEYYLDEDEKATSIRQHYSEYIRVLLNDLPEIDDNHKDKISFAILNLETALANNLMPKEERREIGKIYNPVSFDQLKAEFDFWDWDAFITAAGLQPPEKIIITDINYFKYLKVFFESEHIETLKYYLCYLLIHQAAPFVHEQLEKAHFQMFAQTLEGVMVMRPRNERIVKVINNLLGEALGELFVSKYFPPAAKQTAVEMAQDIVTAYQQRIEQLDWMSDATKAYAIEKLSSIRVKIGFPEKWKSYADLVIKSEGQRANYLANVLAAATWKRRKDFAKIGHEVDREEWFMAPQIVNAYYNPLFNEIVFPAAILQPPFFDWEADAAVNYGGIGAVIGHEITHGFDDQGSRFDKEGNYNEWWSAEDREKFTAHTAQLIRQFDAYYPFEDLALNGTFTLGENIADLGGLCVAYDALQLYYQRHGKPDKIDGFTAEQRFFMSWATVWRTKTRPEALRKQIKTDPHPPGMYRAIAAPSNMNSFYQAFEVTENSPWYRKNEERIRIW